MGQIEWAMWANEQALAAGLSECRGCGSGGCRGRTWLLPGVPSAPVPRRNPSGPPRLWVSPHRGEVERPAGWATRLREGLGGLSPGGTKGYGPTQEGGSTGGTWSRQPGGDGGFRGGANWRCRGRSGSPGPGGDAQGKSLPSLRFSSLPPSPPSTSFLSLPSLSPSPPSPPSSPSSPSPRLSCPLRAARRAQSSWVKATSGHGDKTLPREPRTLEPLRSLPCGSRTQHPPSIPHIGVVSQVGGLYPGFGGPCPQAGPSQPRCVPAVMLTGGIVAVAGQFKGWYFAAYAMYPYGEDARGWAAGKPALIGVGDMDGGTHHPPLHSGPKSLFPCPKQPFFCTNPASERPFP